MVAETSRFECVDRIILAQQQDCWQPFEKTVRKFTASQKAENFLTSLETISFTRSTLIRRYSLVSRL
jgi:hypothetical protein